MIELSVKAKADTIERTLLTGDVHAAEELFRADYIDAVNQNRPDMIEAEKRLLQKDPAGYKLIMLEVAKHFVKSNSNSEDRLMTLAAKSRMPKATAEERLHGEAAQLLIEDYSELTGGGRHIGKKLFSAHWGHGVVKYDIERVEKELKQDLGARVFANKLADNNYELFRKISDDGRSISADDVKDVLKKDDRLGHDLLTKKQRETVEQLSASMNKGAEKNNSNYYSLPKGWKHISIDEVRQSVRQEDYQFLRTDQRMPISTRIKPRPDASGDDRVCDIYRPINRIRPRPDANGDVNSTDTKLADQKKLEELTKLAVARHHEGYSYIATRLLGFAQPGANKAEIERVYSRLSQENKRSVMALSAALDKANRHAHNGLLLEGDSIPITGAEVQALLKR